MLSFLYTSINRLLPFATPGTPLTTDLIHLAVLCGLLYYAPQIQAFIKENLNKNQEKTAQQQTQLDDLQAPAPDQTEQDGLNHNIDATPNGQPTQADRQEEPPNDHGDEQELPGPPPDPAPADGDPGPAAPRGPDPANIRARQVGAKKAKSLARRDQRRAYNEFMRSQGEAQRAREAEGAAEREAELAEERARRATVEAELREEERREREARKEEERQEEAKERRAREVAASIVRDALRENGWVDLGEVANRVGRTREWLESLVRVEGMLRENDDEVNMVTGEGQLVRITKQMMAEVWRILEQRINTTDAETVSFDEVGHVLEGVLKSRDRMVV
ncbi:Hypothetical protein D9617_26g079040 [Elsinoe fawcettii]|nr:Hypothetical protein D9617_26g079040 [Elsinoe fawcettii]